MKHPNKERPAWPGDGAQRRERLAILYHINNLAQAHPT